MLNESVVEMVTELKVCSVVLNSKLTFESYLRSIAASACSKFEIIGKLLVAGDFGASYFQCLVTALLSGCFLLLILFVS